MEGKVKFHLGEELPFSLDPFGGTVGLAAFTEGAFDTTTKPFRYVVDGPPPPKQLMDKLTWAWTIRKVKWRITLSSRRRESETKFCFEYCPSSELKSFQEGYEGFIQVELRDTDGLQRFTTQEMAVPAATGHNTLVLLDSVYNEKLDHMLMDARGVINGTVNLFLIAKYYSTEVDKMAVTKRMLREEIVTDVVMIPSNGAEVKCHRSFLAAQSPVFHAMFQGSMKEATSGMIEMPHMSEDGVRALLAYIYHWDVSKAHDSCSVALELLEAGHSYNIPMLENAMQELLLSKQESWYKTEVNKALFYFLQNLDGNEWEPLKNAVVMKN